MTNAGIPRSAAPDLGVHGITRPGTVYGTLGPAALVEQALGRGEGLLTNHGPLVVNTSQHTGRSATDKFIVEESTTAGEIWWGKTNVPITPERFEALHRKLCRYLDDRDVFVQDCYAGADPEYRLPVRIITEYAWHSLFARNMFLPVAAGELADFTPGFTVIDAPGCSADPQLDGTHSGTFIIVNFARKLIIIGGTRYAGEIKKSVFSVMNFLLPQRGVLPMHSSANIGPNGDTALFFGLSGTGKTTLSADATRTLIGDDEHGWSDSGLFNFEGGCYAKVINLSAEAEPEIYATTRQFGTVLENVVLDEASREIDLDDNALTENTRGSYPIWQIPNAASDGRGGHPRNVVFLTCDAFGVLPPVSRLTTAQAMYHFISGYTAKVAGTERGVTEPTPIFSPCYGGPFLPLHPRHYAEMLGECIERHQAAVWLINTGWTGGRYGVGRRISIKHTRAIVNACLAGKLQGVATVVHPIFGLVMPSACPGVPAEILAPRNTWADQDAYDGQARLLAERFAANFEKYADQVSAAVRAAGPRVV